MLLFGLLPLADDDRFVVEIDQPRADQLRPPGPGVGRQDDHRVEERLLGRGLDVLQEFVRLLQSQEQAVPECLLFSIRKLAAADLLLDLLPVLERRLLDAFRLLEPFVGEGPYKAGCHGPSPDAAEGGQFLANRDGADGRLLLVLFGPSSVDVLLKLVSRQCLHVEVLTENPLEVFGVDANRAEGAVLNRSPGDRLFVAVD